MRILYLSQYFLPEAGATQNRAYEMAANFVRLGHDVTILAEIPNHPSGIIPPEYRGKVVEREILDGIDVIRLWVKASPKKNFRNRMYFYLSYMVNAFLAGLFLTRGNYDLIYATSPPLFVGAAGIALSYIRRTPMIFEVRDLWPESAIALGELNNARTIQWATHLEEACYRRARLVVVVTEGFRINLLARGIPPEKIAVIPNGANIQLFQFNTQARQRMRRELMLDDKFTAIYAGIHGIAQGLETIVQAAKILQKHEDICFLMVGEGPEKEVIRALVKRYSLDNMLLLPGQPRETIPSFLSAADVSLIPLKKIDLFKTVLPSKLFDAWACERPVILSVDGEARTILQAAQAGVYVPPEDPESLAQALIKIKDDPAARQQMGSNGRIYTVKHYSRQVLAKQLVDILEDII